MVDINLILNIFLVFALFALGVIFVYQSFRKKRKAYSLTTAILMGIIATTIELVRTNTSQTALVNSFLLFLHIGTWGIGYCLIFIFFQRLYTEKLQPILSSIIFALLYSDLLFGFLRIYESEFSEIMYHTMTFVWDMSDKLLGLTTFTFGAFVHFLIYRKTKERKALQFFIFITFIALGFVWGFFDDFISYLSSIDKLTKPNFLKDARIVGESLKIVGLFGFLIMYIVDINYIFRLPVDISTIMVFNRFGMLIYAAQYSTEHKETLEKGGIPIELITASVNAFETFIRETTNSKGRLKRIETDDKIVITQSGELATVAIIANETTHFLNSSMKLLIKLIEENFQQQLKLEYTESAMFSDIAKYIYTAFPYLPMPIAENY